jgi:hypothetical protein
MIAFFANLFSFQICWFALVWGGADGRWWLGFAPLALFATWQLALSSQRRSDLATIALALVLGIAIESLMMRFGWFAYATPQPAVWLAPVWMLGLWANFGLTINHSMAFFKPRPALAAGFGLIGAPLTYWLAGRGMQALTTPQPLWPSLLAIGSAWAVAMPLLCLAARRTAARAALAPATA